MLTYDVTDTKQRLVAGLWNDIVLAAARSAQIMAEVGHERPDRKRASEQMSALATSVEQMAQHDLNTLAKRVVPRPYKPMPREVPINGHAHAAPQDSLPHHVHASDHETGENGRAASDEEAAADGGHAEAGPGSNATQHPVAADLRPATCAACGRRPDSGYDLGPAICKVCRCLAPNIETTADRYLSTLHNDAAIWRADAQDLDRAERQLYTIRSEARDPRMQASARMKFDAVLALLKGTAT
jgi:hypothetical protein